LSAMLIAALVAMASCSRAARPVSPAEPQPTVDRDESAAGAKARADSLRRPYTEADVQFMTHMIDHHAQAVVMAGWAPTHGAGPAVRRLAERIVNGQQDEIASMRQWLRDRRRPVPEAPQPGMKMPMHGAAHHMLMPGMLTEAQMRQLDQASGQEFDHLFLTFMIQHHRGAVDMVKALFVTSGAAQDETVFKFANDVSVDQTSEINRMESMLATLTSETHTQ